MNGNVRRTMPLFPIGIVMQLTELSARQIRYYEEHGLVQPARTEGNRRMFSFNDVDRLLEIKDLIDQGVNMAGIKQVFSVKGTEAVVPEPAIEKPVLSDHELRTMLRNEITQARAGRYNPAAIRHGDMARFFKR